MMLIDTPFRKSLLAAAVISVLSVPTAHALTIDAQVDYTLDGNPITTTHSDTASSGSVDVLAGSSSPTSNIFYHTYGSDSGNFGSRVSGNGNYDITGTFTYSDTIVNNSGNDQSYAFDFTVIPGELTVSGIPGSGGYALASYNIDVLVNGASVWDSSATVSYFDGDASPSFSDTGSNSLIGTFSSSATFGQYFWNTFNDNADLGVFGDGDSFDFEYILTAHAEGDMVDGTNCFDGFDGTEGFGGGQGCGSMARSGDPFFFNTGPNTPNSSLITSTIVNTGPSNDVPEPASIALMGIGLVGFAAASRRRKKK